MSIEAGGNLLHYRIVDKLGEGGMGQVWKAVDTTLDREVAIKVLPEAFAADAERLARFEREARLLAALNHPHIAGVYGLHEDAGVRFLAMELVAGEDLSRRLERGPLTESAALGVGRQVAEALEAAHAAGIVHRDLKPANVVIDADDNVKVLDFGLAKIAEAERGKDGTDPAMSPTITSMGTVAGMIMGTAAYMSPEQARGREVDHRADIWSFGCLLYESLCGRMPFRGETVSDTLAAVLAKEPTWDALERAASPPVEDLVRRCLRKDIRTRLQSIGDARITIEEIVSGERVVEPAPAPVPGVSRAVLAGAVAGAVVLTALVMAFLRPGADESPGPLRKFEVVLEAPVSSAIGSPASSIRLSPDGRRIAYASQDRLWVRELDRIQPRELPGTLGANSLFWSPDGRTVGFQLGDKLLRIALDDPAPVVIGPLPGPLSGGVWLADGRILFNVARGPLMSVAASGGDPVVVLAPQGDQLDFHEPSVMPDGKTLLFSVHRQEGVDTIAAFTDGALKTILHIPGQVRTSPQVLNVPVFSPTGHLLFERNQGVVGIWAAPFSAERLELTGDPFLVVPDATNPTVSEDGLLAYTINRGAGPRQLVLVDQSGAAVRTIGEPQVGLSNPAVSPDGKRIVATVDEGGNGNIWLFEVETGQGYRLLGSPELENHAKWSPDGSRIAYSCGSDEGMSTCVLSMDDETSVRVAALSRDPIWTPDSRSLVVQTMGRRERGLMTVDLEGGGDPEPWLIGVREVVGPRLSPSGRRIAFWLGESASPGYYVTTFPEQVTRRQIAGVEFVTGEWAAETDDLYFVDDGVMKVVHMRGSEGLAMDPPRELFDLPSGARGFAPMPSGEFVVVRAVGGENQRPSYYVVENWLREFEVAP